MPSLRWLAALANQALYDGSMIRFLKLSYFNFVVVFVVIGAGVLSACLVTSIGFSVLGMLGIHDARVLGIVYVFGSLLAFFAGLLSSLSLLIYIIIKVDNGEEFRWAYPVVRFLKSNSLGIIGSVSSIILLIAGLIYGFCGR